MNIKKCICDSFKKARQLFKRRPAPWFYIEIPTPNTVRTIVRMDALVGFSECENYGFVHLSSGLRVDTTMSVEDFKVLMKSTHETLTQHAPRFVDDLPRGVIMTIPSPQRKEAASDVEF